MLRMKEMNSDESDEEGWREKIIELFQAASCHCTALMHPCKADVELESLTSCCNRKDKKVNDNY